MVHRILEKNKFQSGWCHPISNGFSKFQITHSMGGQYAVDLTQRSCSCRACDLSGIPCQHAVAAIYHERGDPVDYVHHWCKKEVMLKAYDGEHTPLADQKEWAKTGLVPNRKRQLGRSKKLRR